jgi:hypothetical protein
MRIARNGGDWPMNFKSPKRRCRLRISIRCLRPCAGGGRISIRYKTTEPRGGASQAVRPVFLSQLNSILNLHPTRFLECFENSAYFYWKRRNPKIARRFVHACSIVVRYLNYNSCIISNPRRLAPSNRLLVLSNAPPQNARLPARS